MKFFPTPPSFEGGKKFLRPSKDSTMDQKLKADLMKIVWGRPPKLQKVGYDRERKRYIFEYQKVQFQRFKHPDLYQEKTPLQKLTERLSKNPGMEAPPGVPCFRFFTHLKHERTRNGSKSKRKNTWSRGTFVRFLLNHLIPHVSK